LLGQRDVQMQNEECSVQNPEEWADGFPPARVGSTFALCFRSRAGLAVLQRNEAARHSQYQSVACGHMSADCGEVREKWRAGAFASARRVTLDP